MSGSGDGGPVISVNALKVKLLEEQKELQELRLNVEKYQDELKVETQKCTEVGVNVYTGCVYNLNSTSIYGRRCKTP